MTSGELYKQWKKHAVHAVHAVRARYKIHLSLLSTTSCAGKQSDILETLTQKYFNP